MKIIECVASASVGWAGTAHADSQPSGTSGNRVGTGAHPTDFFECKF